MKTFGIERERFIINAQGKIVPAIEKLLPRVHQISRAQGVSENLFTFELFAGQIEDRTPPCPNLEAIKEALWLNDRILLEAASDLGLAFDYSEYANEKRVLEFTVNPFNERHQQIWASISSDQRISASVVAAVHVHISATDEAAVKVLNLCREDVVNHLISIGDHSGLKRIKAYQQMAETSGTPPIFANFSAVMEYITAHGGEKNVWDLVRYKPSTKTVEFRMFGITQSVNEIIGYVQACLNIYP